jgi:hypothetical protein
MRGLELGVTHFKFFPAVAPGGISTLDALASVFGDVRFWPTGGITEATAAAWLALDAVLCVGGNWNTGADGRGAQLGGQAWGDDELGTCIQRGIELGGIEDRARAHLGARHRTDLPDDLQ